MADHLIPFLIENRGVRGFAVEIQSGIPEMLGWRHYSKDVERLLGQALAATPLLAADLRDEGRFNIQFKGHGALSMLVTQIDEQLKLRGMAKATADAQGDFHSLMQGGMLACLLEPRAGAEQYRAIVEIKGHSLAEALEGYFERSAQLPTRIRLASSPTKFSGLMIQRKPEGIGLEGDNWDHVQALFNTLGDDELLAADSITLLRRLFPEEDVRVFSERPIHLACRCDHAGISAMLLALGEEELRSIVEEQGHVEVTCEFCGRHYRFEPAEVNNLFAAANVKLGDQTRH
ncbi:MAG TPA: Hsp33 family molecular chaperone HslO [Nevskiaceae bacterium]|nr:Hsp33 family molecular chaperone HslO [Nevskiaceae bacterium]